MWWVIGAGANLVIALAYLGISLAIVVPLVRTRQLRENRLGAATAAIFVTCAVHHGAHSVHMLLPTVGVEEHIGLALREAFHWHQVLWDVASAGVGLWYWSLRSTYGSLMQGAALFEDMREKQRRALEINDNIVQGLAVAKLALELDQPDRSAEALEQALRSARDIITDLLGETHGESALSPGTLVRQSPARVGDR